MAKAGFIVYKSEWRDHEIVGPSGYDGPTTPEALPIRWRALDDDGEIMCRGRCNEEALNAFAPLDCYATPDLGCTTLEYTEEKKASDWKVL